MMDMQCCKLWRSETPKELVELQRSGLLQSGNVDILGQLVTVWREKQQKRKINFMKAYFLTVLVLQVSRERNVVSKFSTLL